MREAKALAKLSICAGSSEPPLLADAIVLKSRVVAHLTLNAPIATKVVFFSDLLKCLRSRYGKQCGPRSDISEQSVLGPRCLHLLNSSVMLDNYLQQMTSADDIFRCIFFLALILTSLHRRSRKAKFLSVKLKIRVNTVLKD